MSYSNVGKVWTPETLARALRRYKKPTWCNAVTLHHTASPTLAQRPKGWKVQHLRNLEHFYRNTLGWSSGPHFFTDEDQVMGLSPFTSKGVHAVSFNKHAIGIEVLGDYDSESPKSGRGLECWKLAAETTVVLLDWMGKRPSSKTVLFHRDDPKTAKSCPGRRVEKDWVLKLVRGVGELAPVKTVTGDVKEKRPEIGGWSKFEFINGKWYVPVLDVLVYMGADHADASARMKSKGGKFYMDGDLVEEAFYDQKSKKTKAPAHEVLNFI